MKRKVLTAGIAAVILAAALLCFFVYQKHSDPKYRAAKYLVDNTSPSFGNEWTAISLSYCKYSFADEWLSEYKASLENKIKDISGDFGDIYTNYSRCILTCKAIGLDPENICGYNLVSKLDNTERVMERGVNGSAYALLAINSCNYKTDAIDAYIDDVLSVQNENGGFGMNNKTPDVDMTAICIRSLLPYYDRPAVKIAVDKGVSALSDAQLKSGGFSSMGSENSQSISQVIITLHDADIDIDDEKFVKNGNSLTSTVMKYQCEDGGFMRSPDEKESSVPATIQVLTALSLISD